MQWIVHLVSYTHTMYTCMITNLSLIRFWKVFRRNRINVGMRSRVTVREKERKCSKFVVKFRQPIKILPTLFNNEDFLLKSTEREFPYLDFFEESSLLIRFARVLVHFISPTFQFYFTIKTMQFLVRLKQDVHEPFDCRTDILARSCFTFSLYIWDLVIWLTVWDVWECARIYTVHSSTCNIWKKAWSTGNKWL